MQHVRLHERHSTLFFNIDISFYGSENNCSYFYKLFHKEKIYFGILHFMYLMILLNVKG